ncbi:hypothetical protein QR98_0054270 [Sarcoptes scabiei]|uniref:Uncharacterized protein n=1 Tax=Sarcoptes scabiei TaxID=52283 RepID=A0A132A8J3_SARSC|nr:hypothetical protein QR98_0054270 [Sarcoptes scabiei]
MAVDVGFVKADTEDDGNEDKDRDEEEGGGGCDGGDKDNLHLFKIVDDVEGEDDDDDEIDADDAAGNEENFDDFLRDFVLIAEFGSDVFLLLFEILLEDRTGFTDLD